MHNSSSHLFPPDNIQRLEGDRKNEEIKQQEKKDEAQKGRIKDKVVREGGSRSLVNLGEQPLLERVKSVDTSLDLSRCRTEFESEFTIERAFLHVVDRSSTHVLERVLKTGVEVRDELAERTLVLNGTSDTLNQKRSSIQKQSNSRKPRKSELTCATRTASPSEK